MSYDDFRMYEAKGVKALKRGRIREALGGIFVWMLIIGGCIWGWAGSTHEVTTTETIPCGYQTQYSGALTTGPQLYCTALQKRHPHRNDSCIKLGRLRAG